MVTREQLLEYIADKNLVYDDVYPKDDCIYKRKYEQLVKEIKETEVERKARALDEIGGLDCKDKPEQFVREVARIINEIVEGH